MKLTKINLLTDDTSPSSIELSFKDPRRLNPYNIKAVSGLDADEIVPKFAGGINANEFDFLLANRKVVMLIELNPDWSANETFSSLRDNMYRFVGSTRTGKIILEFADEDGVLATLEGFIIKLEAPVSTDIPQIQLTIDCKKDPILRAESITVDSSGFVDGLITIQDDLSTAAHGFTARWGVNSDFLLFTIAEGLGTGVFSVGIFGGFFADDWIEFSSESGNKYIRILRGGQYFNLADNILQGSVWPLVFPGANTFIYSDETALGLDYVTHRHSYLGV